MTEEKRNYLVYVSTVHGSPRKMLYKTLTLRAEPQYLFSEVDDLLAEESDVYKWDIRDIKEI